jgi:type I restriction enzyme S subunit
MRELTELFSRRNKQRIDYPMFSVTNSRGFVNQQEQFEDREMKGEDIAAYKIISPGEFAYNPARINVGSIARYDGESDCMISSLYVCFKAKKELVDSQLLLHILKSPKMVYNYGINGEGGVRIYLFYPNFARIRVKLPGLDEQRKIASFLDVLEQRIELQSKVIKESIILKKVLCQRLFDGSKKSVSLASIADIEMGQSPDSSAYNRDSLGIPLIQGNLDIKDGNTVPSIWTTQITKKCEIGDVILTVRAPVGELAISSHNACIGRGVCRIRCGSSTLGNNIFQYLSFFSDWGRFEQGSTFTAINRKDIEKISIPILSPRELLLLSNIDEHLRLSKELLRKYYTFKDYCLKQLFV